MSCGAWPTRHWMRPGMSKPGGWGRRSAPGGCLLLSPTRCSGKAADGLFSASTNCRATRKLHLALTPRCPGPAATATLQMTMLAEVVDAVIGIDTYREHS